MKIALTLGDPAGIGPEIILKAVPRFRDLRNVTIFASRHMLKIIAQDLHLLTGFRKIQHCIIDCVQNTSFQYGRPTLSTGRAALQSIDAAMNSDARIIVTPPIVKEVIKRSLPDFVGHTEYLAAHYRAKHHAMVGIWRRKVIMLLTTHIPVRRVAPNITPRRVAGKVTFLNECLKKFFGIPDPRIAVSAFNPHAFEFSCGEDEKIADGIGITQRSGLDVHGPYPADTLFDRPFDGFLAIFHDQAMVYLKSKKDGLNFTAGLPVVRLSPLYGAALDIAGKNRAEFSGLLHAMRTGVRLARNARRHEK
jgi:4-hydroxy-L-threonine phosphate dehydrogenase PdxA